MPGPRSYPIWDTETYPDRDMATQWQGPRLPRGGAIIYFPVWEKVQNIIYSIVKATYNIVKGKIYVSTRGKGPGCSTWSQLDQGPGRMVEWAILSNW